MGGIAHVLDPKCGGNLMAHNHVGKYYHSRKKVSSGAEEGGNGKHFFKKFAFLFDVLSFIFDVSKNFEKNCFKRKNIGKT